MRKRNPSQRLTLNEKCYSWVVREKNTKGYLEDVKRKTDSECNGKTKKENKRTNNDLQNTTQKNKDCET